MYATSAISVSVRLDQLTGGFRSGVHTHAYRTRTKGCSKKEVTIE